MWILCLKYNDINKHVRAYIIITLQLQSNIIMLQLKGPFSLMIFISSVAAGAQ